MSWEATRLGDIIEFSNGVNFDKSLYAPGIKLVNVSNFGDRLYPDYSELAEISEDVVKENDYLQNGDIIFVRSNGNKELVGRCMLIENPPMRTTYSGFCIRARIKNRELFDSKFLTYHFKSGGFRTAMAGNAVGANIQNLSQGRLSAYTAYIPSIETQRRIADILSAYDDLIENNRKQIKLLEEAAQRLYKEWFVDLRFPNHEHTKIVDGVPEGWRVTTLDEICSVRKEMLTPEKIDVDTPYIGLEHIPRKDICLSEWGSSSEISSNKFRYYEDDILFGKIRPYFHKVGFALNNGVTSTDAIVLKSTEGLWSLLLMTASSSEFVSYTYQNCKEGAKMPRADWKQMKSYPTIIADRAIQSAFEDQIYTITRKIKVLALQINRLSEARDRLLPKLMSGEVEV